MHTVMRAAADMIDAKSHDNKHVTKHLLADSRTELVDLNSLDKLADTDGSCQCWNQV